MISINHYKNKDVGILGAGLSGMAAAKILSNSKADIFVFDDKKDKPDFIRKKSWKNYNLWPWKTLTALVVSPGIPINAKNKHLAIQYAIKNKVKIINEIDLFFETKPEAKIIGITGTNGKSTTVALLFHILKFNKIKCVIGGNYGFPACEIKDPGKHGIIILELSSYQLDGAKKLSLDLATITNITKDHLDYHETFKKYKLSKLKILNFLKENGTFILDADNKLLNEMVNKKKLKSKNIRSAETGNKSSKILISIIDRCISFLEQGKSLRSFDFSNEDYLLISNFNLLTIKPVLYLCNIDEQSINQTNKYVNEVKRIVNDEGAQILTIATSIESEIAELENNDDRLMFLNEIGLSEPGVNNLITSTYQLLNLQTVFTAGKKEVRAWTIKKNSYAPQAAGVIHTDFEKGFIRAEVIAFDDFISLGSELACKEAGKLSVEGKNYMVNDGDIMHFRFNV